MASAELCPCNVPSLWFACVLLCWLLVTVLRKNKSSLLTSVFQAHQSMCECSPDPCHVECLQTATHRKAAKNSTKAIPCSDGLHTVSGDEHYVWWFLYLVPMAGWLEWTDAHLGESQPYLKCWCWCSLPQNPSTDERCRFFRIGCLFQVSQGVARDSVYWGMGHGGEINT